VRLLVGDNGVGLTPEAKLHLFEPFFTTKEMGRGTGLGLATVHGIVAQSGGHIQVTSRPGEGTTFEISLPTTDKLPTAAAVYKPGRPVIRGMELVLVVEDDSRVRAATVRALESAGYEVVVAANGIEALAIQPGELARVKLLLTDVIMPGHMSGVAIAASLTARHPTLRVLYVSGHAEDALLYRRVLDPGVEFLSKPFTSSSLLGRVRNVLDA
jgi:CheY-like chemotaxis protein